MKKIIICLLILAAFGLVGACFMSIYTDIAFDKDKSEREKVVIARLMQIRDAEEEFRKGHYGEFCGTIDSLIDFVKEGKAVVKIDEDVWTDELAESFESKRAAIDAGKFRSDTVWQSAAEKLGITCPDSLKYVPIGKAGAVFQLRKHEAFNLKSNEFGLSEKKIRLLKQDLKKRGKNRADLFLDNADDFEGEWYGLRIGDLKDPQNKMSGNWE